MICFLFTYLSIYLVLSLAASVLHTMTAQSVKYLWRLLTLDHSGGPTSTGSQGCRDSIKTGFKMKHCMT